MPLYEDIGRIAVSAHAAALRVCGGCLSAVQKTPVEGTNRIPGGQCPEAGNTGGLPLESPPRAEGKPGEGYLPVPLR